MQLLRGHDWPRVCGSAATLSLCRRRLKMARLCRLAVLCTCVTMSSALRQMRPAASRSACAARSPSIRMKDFWKETAAQEVWQSREEFARGSFRALISFKEDARETAEKRAARRQEGKSSEGEATKSAFVASAAAVLLGATLLRFGGRAALVSVLGLDVVADLGIGDQIDQVLQYAEQAGGWTVVAFIGAWMIAKVFLIDVIAIALAFSSGILFGGVLEGALISAVGATLGSLIALSLSRGLLQERVAGFIQKRPVARGLAKVVEADGFKTVFVLRLSPVLPIPTGSYPYIYGTSKLSPLTFAAGYFLGSLKPYLLDAYLGVLSKQVRAGAPPECLPLECPRVPSSVPECRRLLLIGAPRHRVRSVVPRSWTAPLWTTRKTSCCWSGWVLLCSSASLRQN